MSTETREQDFAAHIQHLRQQHPTLDDTYWASVWERQRLQWQVDDLHNGIAELAGRYGYHVEQDPTNTRLAALVDELKALIGAGERRD